MKVFINTATPMGAEVAKGIQYLHLANQALQRANQAKSRVLAAEGTLDAGEGEASFGGSPGSHAVYSDALGSLANGVKAFVEGETYSGAIATLDQGEQL